MSMEAQFLQVEPDLLERLGKEDGLVERLFAADVLPRAFDPEKMRAAILERGPQLLGGTLEHMPPQLREQIEGAVGRTYQALQRGEGGDALFELMKQRLARPQADTGGTHASLNLD